MLWYTLGMIDAASAHGVCAMSQFSCSRNDARCSREPPLSGFTSDSPAWKPLLAATAESTEALRTSTSSTCDSGPVRTHDL